jgi:hypothetical protein
MALPVLPIATPLAREQLRLFQANLMFVIVCRYMDHEDFHFAGAVEGGVFGDNDHISLVDWENVVSDHILTIAFEDVHDTVTDR